MGNTDSKPAEGKFRQELGLLDSTMIVAGSMIGSGIFIVSADMSRQLGSSGWLLAAWAITGVLTLFAALSYGELAAMMPRAGGQYVYLREAYSPLWGFLYGWTLFLVIQTGTVAAVAMAFAKFLGALVPAISEQNKFFSIGRFSLSPTVLVAIGVLVFLSWMNTRGIRIGKFVQNSFTLTKIAALAGLVIIGLVVGSNATAINANFSNVWNATYTDAKTLAVTPLTALGIMLALGTAMVGSLFSSDAWNNITFTAGEVKNPRRNLPLSLFLGVVVVTALYFLANIGYLVTLPLDGNPNGTTVMERGIKFATNDRVGTAAVQVVFGAGAANIMAVLIMISTFGCVNGLLIAGARVYYAMAQDGLFFKGTGRLNPQGVPAGGLWLQCLWACLLTLSGTYGDLLDYVIFAVLIFYVLTMIGIFVLRRKLPNAERPYKAFGYPIIPAVYIICASAISLDLLISDKTRGNTWPGLIIVLSGVPAYYVWRKLSRRSS